MIKMIRNTVLDIISWMLIHYKITLLVVLMLIIYNSRSNSSRSNRNSTTCHHVGVVKYGYYGHCNDMFQKLIILKNSLKDPSSLEIIQTQQLENDRLEVKYRAKNGFGAIVTETKIL